jgi:hypothetical protein
LDYLQAKIIKYQEPLPLVFRQDSNRKETMQLRLVEQQVKASKDNLQLPLVINLPLRIKDFRPLQLVYWQARQHKVTQQLLLAVKQVLILKDQERLPLVGMRQETRDSKDEMQLQWVYQQVIRLRDRVRLH